MLFHFLAKFRNMFVKFYLTFAAAQAITCRTSCQIKPLKKFKVKFFFFSNKCPSTCVMIRIIFQLLSSILDLIEKLPFCFVVKIFFPNVKKDFEQNLRLMHLS